MNIIRMITLSAFFLGVALIPAELCPAQRHSGSGARIGQPIDDIIILRTKIADQIYLYKEVMIHLKEISQNFSDGYIDPGEAFRKVAVLRHAYNRESDPVPPEAQQLHGHMNRMFSRLENYFIHFKRVYREDPYLNARVAETKFYAAQEADRLEFMYLR